MDNSALVAGHLAALGYSPIQTAGIVGNLQQESGQGLDPNASGDNGSAYGIGQWRGDRLDNLKAFAGQQGTDPSDVGTQVKFLDWELKNKEPTAYGALQKAQTPEDAATAFIHFERPQGYSSDNPLASNGAISRLNNARAFFGGAPAATATPLQLGSTQKPPGAVPGLLAPDPATPADKPLDGLLAQKQPGQPQATHPADDGGLLKPMGLLAPSRQAAHPFQLGFKKRTA